MISNSADSVADGDQTKDRQIIVSRMQIVFNDEESQLLTLTDITIYKRLEDQESKNRFLTTMNA